MQDFNYTLVTDGSSDRALIPILTWLLEAKLEQDYIIQSEWADFSSLLPTTHYLLPTTFFKDHLVLIWHDYKSNLLNKYPNP